MMMKKNYTYLMIALMVAISFAFVSCSDKDDTEGTGGTGGSNVVIPTGNGDVKFEPLSDAEVSALKAKGYNIVGTPVKVTQNGSEHVELNDMATVSIKIPDDFPQKRYRELVGVLITDKGAEYLVPDFAALSEGYVRFQTYHFSTGAAVANKKKLDEIFIEYTAVNGWNHNLRTSDLNTVRRKITDLADNYGFGKDDLLGIAFREVLGDNDLVTEAMTMIDAYDEGKLTDAVIKKISNDLTNEIKAKTLALLIGKLEADPKNEKVMACLKEHLTQENMEKLGTRLGKGDNPLTIAWDYANGFANDKLKGYATDMVPFIKTIQAEATAITVVTKYFSQQIAKNCFADFESLHPESGRLSDSDWDYLVQKYYLSRPKFMFGMTLEEIREMYEKRYQDRNIINAKKAEIQKIISYWDKDSLTFNVYPAKQFFGNCDYFQRLSRLHMLMERFRQELVIDGKISSEVGSGDPRDIDYQNRLLSHVILKYMECYPDMHRFYKWLEEEGYLKDKQKKELQELNDKYGLGFTYNFSGGKIEMNVITGAWTYGYDYMGSLEFGSTSKFLTLTYKENGIHFSLNWTQESEKDKYSEKVQCEFDLENISQLDKRKAYITNLSWKRDTDNWSGPNGHFFMGTWGWGDTSWLLKQKQDIAFATNAMIPQTGWDNDDNLYYNATFTAENEDLHPTTCYYHRWTLGQYIDGEGVDEENCDEMLEGSSIYISLEFDRLK